MYIVGIMSISTVRGDIRTVQTGDVAVGGYQLGEKCEGNISSNVSQGNPAHFAGIYSAYSLTPTIAGLTFTLATISTASATTVARGYATWIFNAASALGLTILDASSAQITILQPRAGIYLIAGSGGWYTPTLQETENTLTTTDATPTIISTIPISVGRAFTFRALILSRTGTTPTSWQYHFTGFNNAGTVTRSFDELTTSDISTTQVVDYTLGASVVNIRVTGIAATTINWICQYNILYV